MGLGGVGINLSDLVMLYTGLARGGLATPLVERAGAVESSQRRLLDPVAAWYVGNVLIGAPPPENAPHGRIAFKTGTSYGFRDAWAVGFDGRMTVGVWGRPARWRAGAGAGRPRLGRAHSIRRLRALGAGAGGAGACTQRRGLCHHRQAAAAAAALYAGRRAGRGRRAVRASCTRRTARASRSRTAIQTSRSRSRSPGGLSPLTVMVNGVPLAAQGGRRTLFFQPDGPGFVRLTVMDARGAADNVMVRVQ